MLIFFQPKGWGENLFFGGPFFEDLLEAKGAGKEIALILYDLSSAFDTVEVGVLIEKLNTMVLTIGP